MVWATRYGSNSAQPEMRGSDLSIAVQAAAVCGLSPSSGTDAAIIRAVCIERCKHGSGRGGRKRAGVLETNKSSISQYLACRLLCFSCDIGNPEPLPTSYEHVGIDLGVTHFASLSTGEFLDHPRYLRKAEKKLAVAQQALSRKKRGSHRRKKAAQHVANCHRKVARIK